MEHCEKVLFFVEDADIPDAERGLTVLERTQKLGERVRQDLAV